MLPEKITSKEPSPFSSVEDTIVAMHSDFKFSITSDSIMVQAMKWAKDGQRVTLTYDEYKGKVLWRGNNKNIVTKIEPDTDLIKANPDKPVSTEPGTDK